MSKELDSCPHCGSEEFYRKVSFSGKGQCNYRFDGGDADNTHLHDSVNYKASKMRYCTECHKPLGSATAKN